MAARDASRQTSASRTTDSGEPSFQELRRISKLLALIAVKGESQEEKVLTLTGAGFTASEVAQLLRTTANTVAVTVYQSKKKPKKKLTRKQARLAG